MAFSPSPIFMEEWFDEKVGVYVLFFGLVLYRWTCNGEKNDLTYSVLRLLAVGFSVGVRLH
jgi:hypothetical protein